MSHCAIERRRKSEDGVALVTVLVFLILIAGLGVVLFSLTRTNSGTIRREESVLQALEAAQTGIVQASFEIARSADLDASTGVGNVAGLLLDARYQVVATPLARRHWRLEAVGVAGDIERRLQVVIAPQPTGPFRHAIAATQTVTLDTSATTDSYDSILGSYLSQATRWDLSGRFARRSGSIMSNSDLSLSGSSTRVRGDARPGPGISITGDGFATVTGSTVSLDQTIDLPHPERSAFESAYLVNDNLFLVTAPGSDYNPTTGKLRIPEDQTLELDPGRYFLSGIELESGARLRVTGETEVFLTGNLDASLGTIETVSGSPQDLAIVAHPYNVPLIYAPPANLRIDFQGGSSTALTVYAPKATIHVTGNLDVYGALIGKHVIGSEVAFHYDEALGFDGSAPFQPFTPVAWFDKQPVAGVPVLGFLPGH
ncbi:MAG: hypothetical protein RL885_05755 [Planctomycetota bacterium]